MTDLIKYINVNIDGNNLIDWNFVGQEISLLSPGIEAFSSIFKRYFMEEVDSVHSKSYLIEIVKAEKVYAADGDMVSVVKLPHMSILCSNSSFYASYQERLACRYHKDIEGNIKYYYFGESDGMGRFIRRRFQDFDFILFRRRNVSLEAKGVFHSDVAENEAYSFLKNLVDLSFDFFYGKNDGLIRKEEFPALNYIIKSFSNLVNNRLEKEKKLIKRSELEESMKNIRIHL